MVSSLVRRASSAARLMSAGTTGVRATCIRAGSLTCGLVRTHDTVAFTGATPARTETLHSLARQVQCSLYRLDNRGADCGVRIFGTQTIVKNLSHQRSVTKYTSGHGHRDDWLLEKKTANHNLGNGGQFSPGLRQHRTC